MPPPAAAGRPGRLRPGPGYRLFQRQQFSPGSGYRFIQPFATITGRPPLRYYGSGSTRLLIRDNYRSGAIGLAGQRRTADRTSRATGTPRRAPPGRLPQFGNATGRLASRLHRPATRATTQLRHAASPAAANCFASSASSPIQRSGCFAAIRRSGAAAISRFHSASTALRYYYVILQVCTGL